MYSIYKLNQEIKVFYRVVGALTGITDLQMDVFDPTGSSISGYPAVMTEVGNGIYEYSFTPTETGRWWVKITSVLNPENGSVESYYIKDFFSPEPRDGGFIIVDSDGHEADVTPTGRLQVSTELPPSPPGTTDVNISDHGQIAVSDDNTYLIPNGETLYIQRFTGGAEVDASAGSSIELYYDPNGNGIGMTLIDVIYASGNSDQHDLNNIYVGDGVKTIRMRRIRHSGGSKEIFGSWRGYF